MTPSETEKEYIHFIDFWEWQYTRRNQDWRRLFECGKNYLAETEKCDEICSYTKPFCGWWVDSPDDSLGPSFDQFVTMIAEGTMMYYRPIHGRIDDKHDPFEKIAFDIDRQYMGKLSRNKINNIVRSKHKKIYSSFGLDYEHGDRLLCFNVENGNTTTLIRYVESLKEFDAAFNRAAEAGEEDPHSVAYNDKKYRDSRNKYEFALIKEQRGKLGNWKNNEQRIIGLWLYDYCFKHNCGGPTAFAALRKTNYLERLGLTNALEDDRPLERWLAGTKACVEAAEVLPLTG